MNVRLAKLFKHHDSPDENDQLGSSGHATEEPNLPVRAVRRFVEWRERRHTRVGHVDFGDLRRLDPIARNCGVQRGHPIDRFYIEAFLAQYAADVRGRVLEIGDDGYTRKFGAASVTRSDVLRVHADHLPATIVADLANGDQIPSNSFDCAIVTQTLQFIYDFRAALGTLHRILAPGGVLLLTVPGIAQASVYDREHWGEYWRFTGPGIERLLQENFGPKAVSVHTYGNMLASIAFLNGMVQEDLHEEELAYHDPEFELVVAGRAQKAG
jgi:SAM-dependent methyltransferase